MFDRYKENKPLYHYSLLKGPLEVGAQRQKNVAESFCQTKGSWLVQV